MWQDIVNTLESDECIKYKVSFLHTAINVHGISLQNDNDINLVKSKIREFCSDATKRTEGLLLLYAVVHCSSTLYVDNWSQIVLGSLMIPSSLISREIPLKVMNRMLVNFGKDSVYSEVFSKVIPEILPILLKPEDKTFKLSCQSLAVCMKYVPGLAVTRVDDIEQLLLKELDSPYGDIVEAVAECFAVLPVCLFASKGVVKVEYKDTWCNIFMKILNTMDLVFNSLLTSNEDVEKKSPVFNIQSLETENDISLSKIDVFKSLCLCMAKMMSFDNDPPVCLPVKPLFETLLRIFQIEKKIKAQNQNARIVCLLRLGFPQMLNGIYIVLEALILNFSILEQSNNFLDIMKQSLDAMEETSFSPSSVSQVRGSTWKLINVWLKKLGTKGSCVIAQDKTILQEILADIDIGERESFTPTHLKASNIEENNQNGNEIFACTHALKVLKNLLETSSCYMEENQLNNISSTLTSTLKVLSQKSPKKPFPAPYSDETCRKTLYSTFLFCAIYSDPLHSKCIVEAQHIFKAASKDPSTKVSRLCHRFRKLSRYYLNPRKPPPDAVQYSHQSMLVRVQQPVIAAVRSAWGDRFEEAEEWNGENGHSSDDQMEGSDVAEEQGENAYSDRMENEGDLMHIEQIEENDENHVNHARRRVSKQSSQSVGEEESIDDSDIEPTYVSTTNSNPQRIGMNDSNHANSFGMQSCVEQYANETRTERRVSEEVVSELTNSVENNIEEHVSAFVEVKSVAQKQLQVAVGNGEWKRKENVNESDEDDSDMEEEGDEEAEANEEASDNAADEASDGKRSPEFEDERPSKRQKCVDEEGDDDDIEDDVEDEDIPVNNQSSDEEENEVNNLPVIEKIVGSNSENLIDEELSVDIDSSEAETNIHRGSSARHSLNISPSKMPTSNILQRNAVRASDIALSRRVSPRGDYM